MQQLSSYLYFKQTAPRAKRVVDEDLEQQEQQLPDHTLYCANCHKPVTDQDQIIDISGSHSHSFTNPAGYVYTIGCFQSAEGCQVHGHKTNEHSWFPEYLWQLAFCLHCQQHLGWLFSNSDTFFALILSRLTDRP